MPALPGGRLHEREMSMWRYRDELEGVGDVWRAVLTEPLAVSRPQAIDDGRPLVAIGSGCSFAVAALAAEVLRSRSTRSAFCTPFDAEGYIEPGSTVLMITAAAAHPDVFHVLEIATHRHAQAVVVTLNR